MQSRRLSSLSCRLSLRLAAAPRQHRTHSSVGSRFIVMGDFGSNRAAWLMAGFLGRKLIKVRDGGDDVGGFGKRSSGFASQAR